MEWWRSAAAIDEIAATLRERYFAVLDNIVPEDCAGALREACASAWASGLFRPSRSPAGDQKEDGQSPAQSHHAGDGKKFAGTAHKNRSDWIAWDPDGFDSLLSKRVDALVSMLRDACPRLFAHIKCRQRPMVSRYTKNDVGFTRHVDNHCIAGHGPHCNGRVLTAVYYMQEGAWDSAANGGCLRLYRAQQAPDATDPGVDANDEGRRGGATVGEERSKGNSEDELVDAIADIAPVDGRLVLFFSDFRCPHEVLPVRLHSAERWAATVWYWGDAPVPDWWVDGVHDCALVPL